MLSYMPMVYWVYAAILFAGGILGFVVAKSPMSLVGSGGFALIAVIAGVLTRSSPATGLVLGLADALAVTAFFVYRYVQTGKPMPAFPTIALSLLVALATLAALAAARRAGGGGG